MNEIAITWIELVSGIIGIISFVFAIVVFFAERGLKKHLESGLISLIGLLDTTALMGASEEHSKKDLALYAEAARNQAISLLRSFSNTNHRHETYDFGLKGRTLAEVIKKRKIATGIGVKDERGCILEGQPVLTPEGHLNIEDAIPNSAIMCFEQDHGRTTGSVVSRSAHVVKTCLTINRTLAITATNLILVRDIGWIEVASVRIGDYMFSEEGTWKKVFSIEHQRGEFLVYALKTSGENFYASGFLVHNKAY